MDLLPLSLNPFIPDHALLPRVMSQFSYLNPLEAIARSRRSSSASNTLSPNSSIPRPVSPYHELRMWDREEEDLIQLHTPRLSATISDITIQGKSLDLASDSRTDSGIGISES